MNPALVIMAAGMSTRYGRLKQLDAVGPAGEALLDFTLHDAAHAGFDPAIIVVRDETVSLFLEHFDRFPPPIPVKLAIQGRDGRPSRPDSTWRPWGTGHAVLAAETHLNVPFAVANADDHYGADAFAALGAWASTPDGDGALVSFRVDRTLSAQGGVTRALCRVHDGWLRSIVELFDVRQSDDGLTANDGTRTLRLEPDAPVSMNLWGFDASMAARLRSAFDEFVARHGVDPDAEFRVPDVVNDGIDQGDLQIRVIPSPSSWFGLTFEGDRDLVQSRLRDAVGSGEYPERPAQGRI